MREGIGYHDPADFSGVVGHWRLDELVLKDLGGGSLPTFEDEVGGYDLQAESGTAQLTQLAPGLIGAHFDLSVHLSHPNVEAALAITGDMAFGFILVPHWTANESTHYVVRCGGLSTDPAVDRNSLWGFRIFGNGSSPVCFHDTAAPAAVSFTDSAFTLAHGLIQHVWISRISNVYRVWINRRLTASSPSGTLTAPGGGAAAKLRLGGQTPGSGTGGFKGGMASFLLIDGTTDDADAETAFDTTVGLVLPRGLP